MGPVSFNKTGYFKCKELSTKGIKTRLSFNKNIKLWPEFIFTEKPDPLRQNSYLRISINDRKKPWLKFYGDVPESIDFSRLTLYESLMSSAAKHSKAIEKKIGKPIVVSTNAQIAGAIGAALMDIRGNINGY